MPGIKDNMLPKLEVEPPDEAEVQAAFDALLAEASAEPSAIERLRQLPTPVRTSLGIAGCLAAAGGVVLFAGVRPDLGSIDGLGFALAVGGLVAASAAATISAMRGPHRAELGVRGWLLAAALIGGPAISPLIPGLWQGMNGAPDNFMCLGIGCMAAAAGCGAVLLLSRWAGSGLSRMALVGAGGGLAGFASQSLFCPSVELAHQLMQHSSLALIAAVALIAARKLLIR